MLLIGLTSLATGRRLAALIETIDPDWQFRSARDCDEVEELRKTQTVGVLVFESADTSAESTGQFTRLRELFLHVPLIVIGPEDNRAQFDDWIKKGAEDYIPVNRLDVFMISRAVACAGAKKNHEEVLHGELQRAQIP